MRRETVDILICGGGLAGLICAAGFEAAGYSVLLVDPAAPKSDTSPGPVDQRSTAFLRPAQALFSDIGLWPELSHHGVAMQALKIVDTTGDPPRLRAERQFNAAETGDGPLGWNFANTAIREALLTHLAGKPGVALRYGTGFSSMICRTTGAIVTLSDNSQIEAALVIGADGRHSAVRDAVGISAKTIRYGQKSIACTATHAKAHNFVSTEIYHTGGPFTMVPLADIDGKPASAIVWMNPGRKAQDLAALPPPEFGAAMTHRSAGLFGAMQLVGERALWPIVSMRAARLVSARTALIAEAAHVLPPIGAQGLNTSLNDIAALLGAARAHRGNLGEPAMLSMYQAARQRDIAGRAVVIDLFNRVTRSGDIGLLTLRLAGLKAVHDIKPLRRGLMRAGMGPVKILSGKSAH